MKKINYISKRLLLVLLAILLACVNNEQALAVTGANWVAGNITDDIVFYNNNSMTVSQIQDFLNSKVPTCDSWGAGSYAGTTRRAYGEARGITYPLTCLKDYYENTSTLENNLSGNSIPNGAISAAQIIKDTANTYNINPQALIVLLQKEQGLVTDDWPWPYQYKAATGYGCPDTAACDADYYGFYNQVNSAAWQFRYYANNPNSYNHISGQYNNILYNPNSSCGSSSVYIQNQATASLYNYTPYQPNQAALDNLYSTGDSCSSYGNRNYWRYFNDWFGSTTTSSKWLRQSTADGQVWLVVQGTNKDGTYESKKWRLTSWDIYLAYGLQYEPVAWVSEDYLSSFTDDGTLGTVSTSKSYNEFQFMDNNRRYYIPGIEYCKYYLDGTENTTTNWGIDCFNTNVVKTFPGDEFLERVPGAGQLKSLFTASNNVTYLLSGGKKWPMYDSQTFLDMGYNWSTDTTTMQDINTQQPLGKLLISHDALVWFTGTPLLIYDSSTKQYHDVGTYETFNAWGLSKIAKSVPTSSYDTTPPTIYSALSVWATDSNGHKYIVDNGRKIDVTNYADELPADITWQTIAQGALNNLSTTSYDDNSYVWDRETGAVYKLDNGTKRWVPNWGNFVGLGLSIGNLTQVADATLSQIPDGNQKLADGSLFLTSTGIYMVSGETSYHVPTWDYISTFNLDTGYMIQGNEALSTEYPSAGELSGAIKSNDGSHYIVASGNRHYISESTMAAWGLTDSDFILVSDSNINRLNKSVDFDKFFLYNGDVYYYGNGQKHHILSYETYCSLGSGYLPQIAADVFEAIPLGDPIE